MRRLSRLFLFASARLTLCLVVLSWIAGQWGWIYAGGPIQAASVSLRIDSEGWQAGTHPAVPGEAWAFVADAAAGRAVVPAEFKAIFFGCRICNDGTIRGIRLSHGLTITTLLLCNGALILTFRSQPIAHSEPHLCGG